MRITKRTCWLCLKSREAFVEVGKSTLKNIKNIFKAQCPDKLKNICFSCDAIINSTISWNGDRPSPVPVDTCFGCENSNVIKAQAFLENLLEETKVVILKKPKYPVKSCCLCLTALKRCVKMENCLKKAFNPTGLKVPKGKNVRVSAKFASINDLNIQLVKVPIKKLENLLDELEQPSTPTSERKRKTLSPSPVQLKKTRYDTSPKPFRSRFELKKSTAEVRKTMSPVKGGRRTMSPTKTDRKSISPVKGRGAARKPLQIKKTPASVPKKRSPKKRQVNRSRSLLSENDRMFIKFETRGTRKPRITYGKPHSASKTITIPINNEELEKLFDIKFKTFDVKVVKIDPTLYLGGRLAVVGMRPSTPENDETIGLDDEDVQIAERPSDEAQSARKRSTMLVERHNEDEAKTGNGNKRKSILVTERNESPRTVGKKVKFNDKPTMNDSSTEEDEKKSDNEGEKDNDKNDKSNNKKSSKNSQDDDDEFEDAEDLQSQDSKKTNEIPYDVDKTDEKAESREEMILKNRKKSPSPKELKSKNCANDDDDELDLPKTPPRRNGSDDMDPDTDYPKKSDKAVDSGTSMFDLLKENKDKEKTEKAPPSPIECLSDIE